MLLSDVCLSRTSGLSREQRPRKTKIGTEVAHITRDSDTTFKVKRSKVKVTRPLYYRGLNAYGGCRGERENVFGVRYFLLRCVCSAARDGGGEGRGILCRHAHSLLY